MPYLTPDEIPEETDCRSLLIPANSDWLALVSGAINELAKVYNWQQFGTVTREEAAARMLEMWSDFVDSGCSGTCRIYRNNPITMVLEFSDNEGETWNTDTSMPAVPARPSGETDKICLASANAAHVIGVLYEETIDAWNINQAYDFVASAFATAIGVAISSLFGAPAGVVFAAGAAVFSLAYRTLDILFTDYWTGAIESDLACLFRQRATLTGDVVTFNGELVMEDLRTRFYNELGNLPAALVWEQIVYLLSILGQTGLNHAGATTAVETFDCAQCDMWCFEFLFTEGTTCWEAVIDPYWNSVPQGQFVSGTGLVQTAVIQRASPNQAERTIQNRWGRLMPAMTLKRLELTYDFEPGQTVPSQQQYMRVLIGGTTLFLNRMAYSGTWVWEGTFSPSAVNWQIGGTVDYRNNSTTPTGTATITKLKIQGTGTGPNVGGCDNAYQECP